MLLQVPEAVLMTSASAARDIVFGQAIQAHAHCLTAEQVLTAHLLHETARGNTSFWHPYIGQLPHEYSLMMTFTPAHVQALQMPHAQQLAQAACDQSQHHWDCTKHLLASLGIDKKWCSLKAWRWAASTVCSRTMHVPFCPAGALTPFGDLHNYHPAPPPHYPDIEGMDATSGGAETQKDDEDYGDGGYHEAFQEYCLYGRKRYAKGEQVFLCYGKYTNLELLEHYGFTLADNPHDQADIPLSAFPESFTAYLTQQGRGGGRHCFLHCNGIPSWALLRDLRCFAAKPAERKRLGHLAVSGQRISAVGDLRVFGILKAACEAVLAMYTSFGHDEEVLKQCTADACMQAAVSWRIAYKRCLHSGIAVAEQASQELRQHARDPA
ncbi:hypothetical protein ABBQ32_012230 [Trebouxia sp. C0010 RCD-2024]